MVTMSDIIDIQANSIINKFFGVDKLKNREI